MTKSTYLYIHVQCWSLKVITICSTSRKAHDQ